MKLTLYRMATSLGGPLIRYYLSKRLKQGKEDPDRFPERLGIASLPRPDGEVVWIHCASVGESLSVLPLIDRLLHDCPKTSVLVTTGTVTSARLMIERLPSGAFHQFVPVDRVSYIRRFLEHWRPCLGLWVESEFWPNLVIETRARGMAMVLLNGRMSEGSYEGWRKSRSMIQRILSSFRVVLAQSEMDAVRFRELGAKNVEVPGNLKFASAPLPADETALASFQAQVSARALWLAASTHAGEEALAGGVHQAIRGKVENLLTIIVPRHPHRGDAVTEELRAQGLNVAQRSADEKIDATTDIYVADTMGEMGLFYRLSDVVFIGKTFSGGGGQNPIEPAQLHSALLFGPDMSNFAEIADKLTQSGGARTVHDADELAGQVKALLLNAETRTIHAKAAQAVAASEGHVLDRVMEELCPYLKLDDEGAP